MKQWVALTLLIPQEFLEPVSNFLMEQGATGLEEEMREDSKEIVLKAYFPRDGREKKAAASLHRYMRSLTTLFSKKVSYRMSTAVIPEQDWGENWKQFFKPVRIGSTLVVFPPWEKARLKKGRIPVEITPGMAFGTGTHGTTQLCIEALEKRLRRRRGLCSRCRNGVWNSGHRRRQTRRSRSVGHRYGPGGGRGRQRERGEKWR